MPLQTTFTSIWNGKNPMMKILDYKPFNKITNCPNCNEPNKIENGFCFKCKMILSYDSYNELRTEDNQKITNLENDME